KDRLNGETVVVYGDVLFRPYILNALMAADGDIVLAVDALNPVGRDSEHVRDLVSASRSFSGSYLEEEPVHLRLMSSDIPQSDVSGEWMGVARLTALGASWVREEIDALEAERLLDQADLPLLFSRIAKKHPVGVHYFTGHWLDVDTLQDLANARNF